MGRFAIRLASAATVVLGATALTGAPAFAEAAHHRRQPPPPPPAAVKVRPGHVVETSMGSASWTLYGANLYPRMDLAIDSTNVACSVSGPTKVTTDFAGQFNGAFSGTNCAPGRYPIVVSEQLAPHRAFTAFLTITTH